MNLGLLIGGLIFDHVRGAMHEYGRFTVPLVGGDLSTYRTLFLVSFLLTLPNLVLMGFMPARGSRSHRGRLKIAASKPKYPGASLGLALAWTIRDAAKDTLRIFSGLWRQPGFYKFLSSWRWRRCCVCHRSQLLTPSQIRHPGAGAGRPNPAGSGPC